MLSSEDEDGRKLLADANIAAVIELFIVKKLTRSLLDTAVNDVYISVLAKFKVPPFELNIYYMVSPIGK